MSTQVSIHPEPGDEPRGRVNPGTYPGRPEALPTHPFGTLHLDRDSYISLGQLTEDQAVAYLDHLADEASSLAARIRVAQRDAAPLAGGDPDGRCVMGTRIHVSAAEVKAKWFSHDAAGMIHDHSTGEVVIRMADGTEYACTFEEHAAELHGGTS